MVLPKPLVVSTIIFLSSEESYKDDLSNNYETCEELEKLRKYNYIVQRTILVVKSTNV